MADPLYPRSPGFNTKATLGKRASLRCAFRAAPTSRAGSAQPTGSHLRLWYLASARGEIALEELARAGRGGEPVQEHTKILHHDGWANRISLSYPIHNALFGACSTPRICDSVGSNRRLRSPPLQSSPLPFVDR